MNILDIVKRVERDLGNQFPLVGLEYIAEQLIDSYRDIYNMRNWDFYLKSKPLKIYKYISLPLYEHLSNGSPTVVVDNSIAGYNITGYDKIYTGKDQIPYQILSYTENAGIVTFNITPNNITYVQSGTYISIYKQDYELPDDYAFNKEIILVDLSQRVSLNKVSEPTFSRVVASNYFYIGEPVCYMAKSKDYYTDVNNKNHITIYPFLSSTEKYLQLWYYRKPFTNFDTFALNNDYLLDIPEEFTHLLYWKALELCYAKLGDARLGYAIQKRQQILNDLICSNDGDIAMNRVIAEYPPVSFEEDIGTLNIRIS